MQCFNHNDKPAIGTCSNCGKAVCNQCAISMEGKIKCRECLAKVGGGKDVNVNTAFTLELIGGFLGFLGIGYLMAGKTNDGIIRLIVWFIYNVIAYIIVVLLTAIWIGLACIPFQIIIQICIPIWSAIKLKKDLLS